MRETICERLCVYGSECINSAPCLGCGTPVNKSTWKRGKGCKETERVDERPRFDAELGGWWCRKWCCTHKGTCEFCQQAGALKHKRFGAFYCSKVCRQAAWRARNRGEIPMQCFGRERWYRSDPGELPEGIQVGNMVVGEYEWLVENGYIEATLLG